MGEKRNDTKFRGGFTPKADGSFLYHCHNCGFATTWEKDGGVSKKLMKFMNAIGIQSTDIPISLRLLKRDEKLKIHLKSELELATDFKPVQLPLGSHSFEYWCESDDTPDRFIEAFEYMASRGDAVFNGWKYYWTPDTKYGMDQRVIVPFYYDGMIVGYTCRSFSENEKINRYYSNKQEDYMFNQNILENDDGKYAIIVEGVFDAISIDGVGTLKNDLSKKQINLLNHCTKEKIIVPDLHRSGLKLVDHALENDWWVSIPDWDADIKDCADATKKYGKLFTLSSIIENKSKDRMRIKTRFNTASAVR